MERPLSLVAIHEFKHHDDDWMPKNAVLAASSTLDAADPECWNGLSEAASSALLVMQCAPGCAEGGMLERFGSHHLVRTQASARIRCTETNRAPRVGGATEKRGIRGHARPSRWGRVRRSRACAEWWKDSPTQGASVAGQGASCSHACVRQLSTPRRWPVRRGAPGHKVCEHAGCINYQPQTQVHTC